MIVRIETSLCQIGFAYTLALALALAWGIFTLPARAEADGDFEKIVQECAACHGEKGASTHEDIPIIGGMSAFYIEEQLRAYQKERPCEEVKYPDGPKKGETTDMCKVAEDLTEDRIIELSEYYDGQPFVPAKQEYDADLAAKGARIHERNCGKCHSEGGSLAFDDAGILAGQWKAYLRQSFKEYCTGDRWQPEKMEPKIGELSDADIQALIEYYASEGK